VSLQQLIVRTTTRAAADNGTAATAEEIKEALR
jgi:hypothetical protein